MNTVICCVSSASMPLSVRTTRRVFFTPGVPYVVEVMHVAVVWDAPGPKRRKQVYAQYKATRDAAPEDLRAQFPWIRRIVKAYRLTLRGGQVMRAETARLDVLLATARGRMGLEA